MTTQSTKSDHQALHQRLEQVAEVKFSESDIEQLVMLTKGFASRFPADAKIPAFMVPHIPSLRDHNEYRKAELAARRAFVEAVEGIWREARRRKGRGSTYNQNYIESGDSAHETKQPTHKGPLLELLVELLRNFGCSRDTERGCPSRATLHHDLAFLATARERKH